MTEWEKIAEKNRLAEGERYDKEVEERTKAKESEKEKEEETKPTEKKAEVLTTEKKKEHRKEERKRHKKKRKKLQRPTEKKVGKDVSAEGITPKEQKKYLIDAIDDAIKEARSTGEKIKQERLRNAQDFKEQEEFGKRHRAGFATEKKKYGTVIIDVPGDGSFEIINTKEALQAFKENVKSFPFSVISKAEIPSIPTKATGKRVSGEAVSYYNEYKVRKQGIIPSEAGAKSPFNFYSGGWFSEGHYAVKTEKPEGLLYSDQEPDVNALIPKASALEPAVVLGEFSMGEGENPKVYAHIISKNEQVIANDKFIDLVYTEHPNAEVFLEKKGEGIAKIVFREGKDAVGLVMPMRLEVDLGGFTTRIEEIKKEKGIKEEKKEIEETKEIAEEPTVEELREISNTAELDTRHRLKNPIKGPTGAQVVGYEWVSHIVEGTYKDRRESDWSQSQTSVPTGRSIVHLFWVQTPDGKETLMGVGAAKNALGFQEDKLYRIAKQAQEAQAYHKKLWDDIEKDYLDKLSSPAPGDANREWRERNPNAKPQDFMDGVLLSKEGKWVRTVSSETIAELEARGWERKEHTSVKKEPTGTSTASVGDFNVGGPGAPTGQPRPSTGPQVNPMEMPEMVEFYNELAGGKYPNIKKRLRAFYGLARGSYHPGAETVNLKADIFADPAQARATLAHEIGHFLDDLPDHMLHQRGNILGRMASLKMYLKKYLEAYEGAPGPLTEADKKRLMQEAREAVKLEKASEEEKSTSFKDIKLSPDDIKAIWNDVEAKSKLRPVYEFIVSLTEVEKAQILREAMKGLVSAENQRRFRSSMPIEGRPYKDWDQRVRDLFNQLVKEELEKREVFTYANIMRELKDLSVFWKPFTPKSGDKFTKYRFSAPELYADAISVLFNNPALLESRAPDFWKGFFNYIHRKPEAKQVWDEIQGRISAGEDEVLRHRREGIRDMDARGEEVLRELRKPAPLNILYTIRKSFVSKREDVLKRKRQVLKRGGTIPAEEDPDYWTEELPYISAPIFETIREINNKVLKPAYDKGLLQSDIGEYLKYRREATERAKMANPKGYTEADALKGMDFLRKELGDEKFNTLTDLVKEFWRIRQEDVFPILEEAKVFAPEMMDHIKGNENYATFSVIDYLEEKHGSGMTAKIYRQLGTLKEIINPLTATVMKDMSLIRMAQRKMIAKNVVNFWRKNFPEEIQPADRKWNGRFQEIAEPTDPKQGLIVYSHEGKLEGWYVPKGVADIFESDPYDADSFLRIVSLVQRPFKDIMVSKNPAWMAWNSLWRDPKALGKQIPGMTWWKAIKYEIKSFPDAWLDTFQGISTEDVEKLYKMRALHPGRLWRSEETGPETHLDRIIASFGENPARREIEIERPFERVAEYIETMDDLLEKTGGMGERLPKIAAYKFLKENTNWDDKKIAHAVRKLAGSPDFWEKGGLDSLYNNFFWYSNAGKEGMRSAIEAAKEDPKGYAWKTIKYDVLPKVAMWLAGLGLFGIAAKALMDNIPERDKENYLCIPIGETEDKKTVYLIQPHDFQGQVIAGLLYKSLRMNKTNDLAGIFDYMAGGLPYTGVNPILGATKDWVQFMSGRNPYNPFTGKYVMPETVFQAGGKETIEEMLKYTSNQLGGGIIYRFKGRNQAEVKSEIEKILGLPVAGNFLSRFVRVSDQGRSDELRVVAEQTRTQRAKELLRMDSAIDDWIKTPPAQQENPGLIYQSLVEKKEVQRYNIQDFTNRLVDRMRYRIGSPELRAIENSQSTEEKMRIIAEIVKKNPGKTQEIGNQINLTIRK